MIQWWYVQVLIRSSCVCLTTPTRVSIIYSVTAHSSEHSLSSLQTVILPSPLSSVHFYRTTRFIYAQCYDFARPSFDVSRTLYHRDCDLHHQGTYECIALARLILADRILTVALML